MESLYRTLLDNGELFVFMPEAKGEWEKDKKEFTRISSGDFSNDFIVDYDEFDYKE